MNSELLWPGFWPGLSRLEPILPCSALRKGSNMLCCCDKTHDNSQDAFCLSVCLSSATLPALSLPLRCIPMFVPNNRGLSSTAHWHLIHLSNHAAAFLRALHHSQLSVKYNPTISANIWSTHSACSTESPKTGGSSGLCTSLRLCHLSQILTPSWLPNSLLPLLCCCKTRSMTLFAFTLCLSHSSPGTVPHQPPQSQVKH